MGLGWISIVGSFERRLDYLQRGVFFAPFFILMQGVLTLWLSSECAGVVVRAAVGGGGDGGWGMGRWMDGGGLCVWFCLFFLSDDVEMREVGGRELDWVLGL